MSNFRTILPPIGYDFKITHHDKVLSIGSCFAQSIGALLQKYKIPIQLNPFGIIYNPISIANVLKKIIEKEYVYQLNDLIQNGELWYSFDHHGQFGALDADSCLEKINQSLSQSRAFLSQCNRLILTLGTSKIYTYQETGKIVANCHKIPKTAFSSRLLAIEEVVNTLSDAIKKLNMLNPNIQIIVTLSPIRHIRDGLIASQQSKARLLVAIDKLVKGFQNVHYFPAYELLLDDLRDYRFYTADMIHPSEEAVGYIWNYFQSSFFDTTTLDLIQQIRKIQQAAQHRPFQVKSKAHQAFLQKSLELIHQFEKTHPTISLASERKLLQED